MLRAAWGGRERESPKKKSQEMKLCCAQVLAFLLALTRVWLSFSFHTTSVLVRSQWRARRTLPELAPRVTAGRDQVEMIAADVGLGDISGGLETTMDYLPNFTPLERIAITATGNLQRIFSSFYNSPVTVTCVRNEEVDFSGVKISCN
jgi:hypothetical protein